MEELKAQEQKALEAASLLPEEERPLIHSILELQKHRDQVYSEYLSELRQLENKYEEKYCEIYSERAQLLWNKERYWLTVLKNNELSSSFVYPQDEELLKYLADIKYYSDPQVDSFTLQFEFRENPFMHNSVLEKKYTLGKPSKAQGTEIQWKEAQALEGGFFKYFESRVKKAVDSDEDMDEENLLAQEDFELGTELRDEIIPNSVLYYLKDF